MTESEIRTLVDQQIAGFSDPRAIEAVNQWKRIVEPAPDGWLLYKVDDDTGIAYSLSESWRETPWAVVDGFREQDPSVRTYCPDLEDAVRDVVYEDEIPPGHAEVDAREAMMKKALEKRKRKGK